MIKDKMSKRQKYEGVLAMLKDTLDKLESGFYGKSIDFNINPFVSDIEDFHVSLYDDYGAIVDE